MVNRKAVKLDENTVAFVENRCVSIVQQLFSDKSVVVISLDDIEVILKLANLKLANITRQGR